MEQYQVMRICNSSKSEQESLSTKWLKEFYKRKTGKRIDLYASKYRSVHDFMFIWNIFERDVTGDIRPMKDKFANYLWSFAGMNVDKIKGIDKFYKYIRKRYFNTETNSTTIYYNHLGLNSEDLEKVKNVLTKNKTSLQEKNQVCLLIAWRYRNNLFHGNKEPARIIEQNTLFEKVNEYLISYIDATNEQRDKQ